MAQRSGIISLQSFVKKYFAKQGMDEGEIHRYRIILADGLRELAIHHLPIAKTTTLTVDSTNLTSDFPTDFIDYVFIAIERDGRWWVFSRDDEMVDKTITDITGKDLSNEYWCTGPGSVGGHNSRLFQPDYENRRFLFNGVVTSDVVVLKYQSTGVEAETFAGTTDIEFPVYAEEAMESYLRWKVCEYDGGNPSECERRKGLYMDAVRMLRSVNESTLSEIRDAWLSASNQTFIRS